MKGKVKIELFDKDGLLKEKIEKENLITDGIDSIINVPFEDFFECYNSTKINTHRIYSPIVNNLVGGVFLFNSHRTADKTHILPTAEDLSSYVGSAGGTFTGTTSKIKGNLNLNESGEVENGYKYVWDFVTGSFNLASLSLTSRNGGNMGLDFDLDNDTSIGEIFGKYGVALNGNSNNSVSVGDSSRYTNIPKIKASTDGKVCYVSDDFKTMVLGTYSNNTYTLTKYNFVDSMRVNDNFNTTTESIADYSNWEKELIYTITPTNASLLSSFDTIYWEDNYIYSVNLVKNGTTLTVNYVKIDVTTMTIAEEKVFDITFDTYGSSNCYVICNNKLLLNDNSLNKLYIINLDTNSLESTLSYETRDSYALFIVKFSNDLIGLIRGYRSNYIYLVDISTLQMTKNKISSLNTTSIDNFSLKCLKRLGNSPVFVSKSSTSTYDYFNVNIFECFFASIFNLDTTISKADTDTLKITYVITN